MEDFKARPWGKGPLEGCQCKNMHSQPAITRAKGTFKGAGTQAAE
jgi:hypothetical protein